MAPNLGAMECWPATRVRRGVAADLCTGPDFATRHPKQARSCKRHPTGQAYRFQLGPVRKMLPALDEAFRSVRPEQYRGLREQSWSETPKFRYRVR